MTTLTITQLLRLEDIADIDVEEEVRTHYSGRGMYGKTCLGYTGGNLVEFVAALALIILEYAETGTPPDDAWSLFEQITTIGEGETDSMGIGRIHYWPGIQVAEGDDQ